MADLGKMLGGNFDASEEEEMSSFKAIPADDYIVAIKKSENKRNNNDSGSYLSLQFEIKEGKYKGRLLFAILNLDHPSKDAVNMARKEFTSICKATGVLSPEDSEELHGIEIVATVIVKGKTAQYPEGNTIKGYAPLSGAPSSPAKTQPAIGKVDGVAPTKDKVSFE